MSDNSLDAVLGGRLLLHQPTKGHRIGLDALLLAGATRDSGLAIDLGSGVGSVGLAFALLNPQARTVLVDRDKDCLALAGRNIVENGLAERVTLVEADVFAPEAQRIAAGLPREGADLVLTNPPFHAAGSGRISPVEKKRSAHVLDGGTLDDWLRAAASCLRPHGRLAMIHRAEAIADILATLETRFGAVMLRFVHAAPDAPAIRVLVHGIKGSRAPLSVLPPIVLTDETGATSEAAEKINQGSGEPWFV